MDGGIKDVTKTGTKRDIIIINAGDSEKEKKERNLCRYKVCKGQRLSRKPKHKCRTQNTTNP